MAIHAEDTLGGACIAQVIDLPFAIAATKTPFAEGLLAGEDSEILDLIPTGGATVGTTAADQGAIPKEEKVSVRVEEGSAGAAPETIDVPSVAGWRSQLSGGLGRGLKRIPSSKALPSSRI